MKGEEIMYSFYVILAGILWGVISIFIRELDAMNVSSMECVAIRVGFTACLLGLYIVVTDRKKLHIQMRDIPYFLGTGICSIILFSYCYFSCIQELGGAAIPALLLYTAPIFVMVMSALFFRERVTKRKVIALLLTLLGLGFVTGAFTGSMNISMLGFFLGIGSGFGYALYSIFGKCLVGKYHTITITFYTFVVASLVAIPTSGVIGNTEVWTSVRGVGASIMLAIVSTLLPYLLYTIGLEKLEAGKAAILAAVEPFTAAIVGIFLFQEKFTGSKVLGMLCILGGIIYLNLSKEKDPVCTEIE